MPVSPLDKVLYLYPGIQHVQYWYTKQDGSNWEDPYDGLVWNNIDIPKPTRQDLMAVSKNKIMPLGVRERFQEDLKRSYESKRDSLASHAEREVLQFNKENPKHEELHRLAQFYMGAFKKSTEAVNEEEINKIDLSDLQ